MRLIRHGGRILLSSRESFASYYARDTLPKLWRMYYQYGYFKPLVVRKVKGVMTIRQLVRRCSSFACRWRAVAPFSLLAAMAFAFAHHRVCLRRGRLLARGHPQGWLAHGLRLGLVFPTLHFSYGLGYLQGLLTFLVMRRRVAQDAALTPMSR